jgi:uncharacterized protein (TIGR03546 family)
MSLLLKQIFAFFQMLNSETGTNQISSGLALGLVIGFSPFLSLQTFLVLLLLLIFRIQIGAAFLAAFFFKFIAFLLDPVADSLGRAVLEAPSLRSLFVELYNMPLVPLTRFNNSIVMGSGLMGFILAIPAFFVFRKLVIHYRATVVARFKGTHVWKVLTATKFYKWYSKYQELYG